MQQSVCILRRDVVRRSASKLKSRHGVRPMPRPVVFVVLFILGLASGNSVLADIDYLAQARELVAAGKATEAYELLKPVEPDMAGEPDFDYVFGVAALDAGQPLEAVFALERVVDLEPDNGPARGELARAYLALGETDDAQTEFERVKAMDLPPEAQQTIERYLSSIVEHHDRTRTRFRPWILAGFGYDTNINGATSTKTGVEVPALPGLEFAVGGTENSPVWRLGAGTRFTSPLDIERGLSLFGQIGLNHNLTVDEADFSSTQGDGRLGVHLTRNRHQLSLAAEADIVKVETDTLVRSDRESGGVFGQWQYRPNDLSQISSFVQFSLVRFPEQRVRDVNRFTAGVGWGRMFRDTTWTPILFASVFGGFEDAQSNDRGDQFGREFYGVRGGGSLRLDDRQTLFTTLTYQKSDYDEDDPSFLRKRDDDFVDVQVGYRFQYDENWSISPTVTYSNNDSNIVINDYDRFAVMVTVRNDF